LIGGAFVSCKYFSPVFHYSNYHKLLAKDKSMVLKSIYLQGPGRKSLIRRTIESKLEGVSPLLAHTGGVLPK
jgi:hypothetical protein